jgi:hypothetical protein
VDEFPAFTLAAAVAGAATSDAVAIAVEAAQAGFGLAMKGKGLEGRSHKPSPPCALKRFSNSLQISCSFPVLLPGIPCSKANRELRRNCLNRLKISRATISFFAQEGRKFPVSPLAFVVSSRASHPFWGSENK